MSSLHVLTVTLGWEGNLANHVPDRMGERWGGPPRSNWIVAVSKSPQAKAKGGGVLQRSFGESSVPACELDRFISVEQHIPHTVNPKKFEHSMILVLV